MECFLKMLSEEEKILLKQVKILKERIPLYPEGQLEAAIFNGRTQYYLKEKPAPQEEKSDPQKEKPASQEEKSASQKEPALQTESVTGEEKTVSKEETLSAQKRKYLAKKDLQIARAIAQRDYERRLLKELESRLFVVERAKKTYERTAPEEIAEHFGRARQILIDPLILSRAEFVRRWENFEYKGKPFSEDSPEIYTVKGERVRSKSEKIIADTLCRYEIPYRYEVPLQLDGFGLLHPDFQVLNPLSRKEYFWEHLGRMDDEQYIKEALIRIKAYEKNNILPGVDLILTSETKTLPLNMKMLDHLIQKLLLT